MFFKLESLKYNNHTIHLNWRLTSDHASLTVNITIFKEYIYYNSKTLELVNEEKPYILVKHKRT